MSHPVSVEEHQVEHGDALNQIRALIAEAPGPQAAAQRVVEELHNRFSHYDWVGVYWLDEAAGELVLGPWIGPEATEHTRIPVGEGICGAAAASGQTEIIDDVDADSRYLACFATTRSEIVVPIFAEGRVVGEIDIDGSDPSAYDGTDARFLEEVAAYLAPLRPRGDE
jgi:L-methionine (R)-S-oxide reductase